MGTTLEARKLSIVEYLAEVDDETVIMQIENILKPKVDIWDELTEVQKAVIRKGIKELDEGKRIPLKQLLEERRNRK